MKLFFFPDYTSTNPYQKLLYSELGNNEKSAGDIDQAITALRTSFKGEKVIFHLHWQNVITSPAGNSHEHRLLAKQFVSKLELFKSIGGYVIWTIHNKLPHDTKFILAEREFHNTLSECADLIILHDKNSFDIVNEEYFVSQDKVKIIPHGNYISSYPNTVSRNEAREHLRLDSDELVFGFIGQLRPYKGLSEFIDASAPITRKYNASALIAGKPVWPFIEGKVTQQCSPFRKIKVFEGFVQDSDLQLYLNASDVIVLPYRDILTSGSVILAASFSKPVVIPDIAAFEGIKMLDFVFTYDPDAPEALQNVMKEIAQLKVDELVHLQQSALNYALTLDWENISKTLVLEMNNLIHTSVSKYQATYEDKCHAVEVYGNKLTLENTEIAICVVNYKSSDQIKQLNESLKSWVKPTWKMLILDNSESDTEFGRVRATFRDAIVIKPETNLGYAGGNNVLVNYAKNNGIKAIAILNPDILLTEDVVTKILPKIQKDSDSVHAPLVLRENGTITFHSATFNNNDSLLNITHHFDGQELSSTPITAINTDILNGCALFFNADIVDKYRYIPEEYFLYFEETDWTYGIKKAGGRLVVNSDAKIVHTKDSQKGGLPSIPYTYYLLRSALLFAAKYGYDLVETEKKYSETFVSPWVNKIQERAPEYVNCFRALCRMAFQHGHENIVGVVNIFEGLSNFSENNFDSEGFIEGASASEVRGWAVANKGQSEYPTKLIYLVNNSYHSTIKPTIERPDVAAIGYYSVAGFSHILEQGNSHSNFLIIDAYSLKPLNVTKDVKRYLTSNDSNIEAPKLKPVNVLGKIDKLKDGRVNGWACDVNNPNSKLEIEVFIDGLSAAVGKADKPRDDLRRLQVGDASYAFDLVIDPKLLDKKSVKIELRLLGAKDNIVSSEYEVELSLNGYDHHTNFSNFIAWSFENVITPFGQFEKSLKLQRELEFIENSLVESAKQTLVKDNPLISIIMPAYNREDVIEMAINSVLSQTYENYELLVVDDGSKDSTCKIVENLISLNRNANIQLIKAPFNGGVSSARNLGLARAKGDIITYLDSDNEWHKDYLLLVNATYVNYPKADSAFAGQEIWFSDPIYSREFRTSIRLLPFNRSKIENGNFIDLNVFSHRKSLTKKFGVFREDIRRLVDWDLILRYTEQKPPAMIPALMNKYFFGLATNQITSVEGYEQNLVKLLGGIK
ncbi:glycosyltransferase [Alteromonas stellipolaris]|uniref:glycosyltransferase n=1 Tax=Alteromonas stellipolaris TaxID=233316 RepID=UPI001DCA8ED1|nr:glycosyltransferase [Alteromonas stellipolaris]MBZ2163623.1 glycosyltransferase [Alteromonas stellipolaris]